MPAALWARSVAALKFRVPSGRRGLAAPLLSAAKWLVLWAAVEATLMWGWHTRFGPGLMGATMPLLAVEAWITTRRHWRTRLLDTLAFAVPLGALLSLGVALSQLQDAQYGSRGQACAWQNAANNLEFIAEFLYFSACTTLPAFALLVVLWRRSLSAGARSAYRRTTVAALLATLSWAFAFACFFHVITYLFDDIDTLEARPPACVH